MRHYETDQRTIGQVLADKAAAIGSRPFLRLPGRTVSYAELDEMTSRYARGFAGLGIGRGDHVAMMMPNCPEFLFALWGLGKLGAVAVPLNTAAKGELLSYFLTQSDSTALCMAGSLLDRATPTLAAAPAIGQVLVHADEPAGAPGHPPNCLPGHGTVSDLAAFGRAPATPMDAAEPVRASDPHLISAYEVETTLCRHPAVLEAAAVPVPSELGEDDVMAYVVLAPGAEVSYPELIEFCSQQMAYYMVPRYLSFTGELPKTPSEKVEKYKLKMAAAENLGQLWDRESAGITVRR